MARARLAFVVATGLMAGAMPGVAQPAGVPAVPPRRLETAQQRPDMPRLVWQPGHWAWDGTAWQYAWRPGRHVVRRPGATRFLPGRWVQTGGDWQWRRAHWR